MNTEETFPVRLKRWRKQCKLSQKRAAELLGVSRSYLNQVEKGNRDAGERLVNSLYQQVNTSKIEESKSAVRGGDWQKAFTSFIEGASPDSLLARLIELQADESMPLSERNELANLILPVIRRRVAELQKDLKAAPPEDLPASRLGRAADTVR